MSATGAPTQPAPAPAAAGPSAIAGAPTTPAELLTHAYPPVFSGVAADSGLSAVAAAHNPRPTITFRPNRVMVLDIVFPFRVGGLRRNYTSVRPDTGGESGVYRTVAKRCCPGYSRYQARRQATQGRAVTRRASDSQRPTGTGDRCGSQRDSGPERHSAAGAVVTSSRRHPCRAAPS